MQAGEKKKYLEPIFNFAFGYVEVTGPCKSLRHVL